MMEKNTQNLKKAEELHEQSGRFLQFADIVLSSTSPDDSWETLVTVLSWLLTDKNCKAFLQNWSKRKITGGSYLG